MRVMSQLQRIPDLWFRGGLLRFDLQAKKHEPLNSLKVRVRQFFVSVKFNGVLLEITPTNPANRSEPWTKFPNVLVSP